MGPSRLLLCTDLDRTLIPNGSQPEHPAARESFRAFCRLPEVLLVYVTGRHQDLVKQAIEDYALPEPNFAITDVGTRIYRVVDGAWLELERWGEEIAADWQGKSREQLQGYLRPQAELRLQEEHKQNTCKLSYYLSLAADSARVISWAENRLSQMGVAASLIWSIDEAENIGLLDVIPQRASKRHALEFLQQQLGYQRDELLFAGDSGNDLSVLISAIPAVLVANASDEVKQQAQQLAAQHGQAGALYLATEHGSPLGGNYSAGILQGIRHFAPGLAARPAQTEAEP